MEGALREELLELMDRLRPLLGRGRLLRNESTQVMIFPFSEEEGFLFLIGEHKVLITNGVFDPQNEFTRINTMEIRFKSFRDQVQSLVQEGCSVAMDLAYSTAIDLVYVYPEVLPENAAAIFREILHRHQYGNLILDIPQQTTPWD